MKTLCVFCEVGTEALFVYDIRIQFHSKIWLQRRGEGRIRPMRSFNDITLNSSQGSTSGSPWTSWLNITKFRHYEPFPRTIQVLYNEISLQIFFVPMRRYSRLGAYWVSISAVCACLGCWRTRYLRWVTEWVCECSSSSPPTRCFHLLYKKKGLGKKSFVPHAKVPSDELHIKMFSTPLPAPLSFISFYKESSWQERCRQKPRTRWKFKGFYVTVQICYW
jgi:hypothetical protein